MFGNESRPTRIYAYKARRPTTERDRVESQMLLAHRYRNRRVEIELRRREAVDAVLLRCIPDMGGLIVAKDRAEAECERLETEARSRNAKARSRVATAADRATLKLARETRSAARAALKAARIAAFADPGVIADLKRTTAEAETEVKEARKASGLYWGNYLRVDQASGDIGRGTPPRFRRWERDGAICVQVQKGLAWDDVLAGHDTRVRVAIRPPSPDADPTSRRSRETPMADLWVRVGSEGRAPVWSVIPFRLHRQPPEGARVKWVTVFRTIVGTRDCWEVQFTLDRDDWDKADNAAGGTAGLDVNWRVTPAGLRVATLVGDDGREQTLTLPRALVSGWSRAESLQSIRDRNFDAARERLAAWLEGRTDLPEWVAERLARLRIWKSCDRLADEVRRWSIARFPDDEEIFAVMAAWRKQDGHLHDWQDSQRRKNVRRRGEIYRRFVAIVRRHYHTVRVEDTDWKAIARKPGPDEESDAAIKAYARVASVGRLIQFLKEGVAEVVEVPAKDTTRRCHACGTIEDFDAGRELIHTCSRCGTTWDQDRNGAINLLRGPNDIGPFAIVGPAWGPEPERDREREREMACEPVAVPV